MAKVLNSNKTHPFQQQDREKQDTQSVTQASWQHFMPAVNAVIRTLCKTPVLISHPLTPDIQPPKETAKIIKTPPILPEPPSQRPHPYFPFTSHKPPHTPPTSPPSSHASVHQGNQHSPPDFGQTTDGQRTNTPPGSSDSRRKSPDANCKYQTP